MNYGRPAQQGSLQHMSKLPMQSEQRHLMLNSSWSWPGSGQQWTSGNGPEGLARNHLSLTAGDGAVSNKKTKPHP